MYTLEGVSTVANFITAYEKTQYNRDSPFSNPRCFFLFTKTIFLTLIKLSSIVENVMHICEH